MKKFMLFLAAGMVAAIVTGCASVQETKPVQLNDQKIAASGASIAHVNAQNSGLYFLKWPMFTGSVKQVGAISVFDEDSVNVPSTVELVTTRAKALGASQTLDLQSSRSSMMIPFPFPFLFYFQSTNVSGNAIR